MIGDVCIAFLYKYEYQTDGHEDAPEHEDVQGAVQLPLGLSVVLLKHDIVRRARQDEGDHSSTYRKELKTMEI